MLKGETKEHWTQLCERAAIEQNSERLIDLIRQINQMLDEKEKRLKKK